MKRFLPFKFFGDISQSFNLINISFFNSVSKTPVLFILKLYICLSSLVVSLMKTNTSYWEKLKLLQSCFINSSKFVFILIFLYSYFSAKNLFCLYFISFG